MDVRETRFPRPCSVGERSDYAELLLEARARSRVLEQEPLARAEVMEGFLRHQSGLVKPGENELELARIGIDVADGEDAGDRGFELRRVHGNEIFVEVDAPIGDRPELHGEAEEGEQAIGRDLELPL